MSRIPTKPPFPPIILEPPKPPIPLEPPVLKTEEGPSNPSGSGRRAGGGRSEVREIGTEDALVAAVRERGTEDARVAAAIDGGSCPRAANELGAEAPVEG